ncbi:MAG: amidohydrolase [Gemmatimonadota bacterium]|nr:amidohydrolase [Gemmatimonadota bacterium]MDE2865776.1 amidohydrolase [Gemmatimonadota bacterium]
MALLATLTLGIAACSPPAPDPADLIVRNGLVHTLDDQLGTVAALAIRGGRVVAAGPDDEIVRHRATGTVVIDLGGRAVVPGLTDNHFHALGGGPGVDLSGARSMAEVLGAISARAADTEPGGLVVTNSNWHEGQLAEQRLPLRDDLDRAVPAHAVVVVRGGHEFILNSAALERFGIGEDAVSPPGGRIGRYGDGRLNGELVDRAKDPVRLPAAEEEGDPAERLLGQLAAMSALGVTSLRIPGGSPQQFALYRQLAEEDRLPVRIEFLFRVRGVAPEDVRTTVESWGAAPGFSTGLLSVGGVKLGVDGGFEGGWMREPYEEPWGRGGTFFGLQTMPTDVFHGVVRELNDLGRRVATHAVGDAAIDLVLDAYEEADARRPIGERRWTIEHGFIPAPDQFERMRRLGLTVTAQHHLYVAAPSLVDYWGAARAALTTPVGLYVAERVPVSLGTDSPVIPHNPWHVLYHFTTRGTISAGTMGAEYAVTREQALRLMTLGYAYQVFAESERGTLAPGMAADLAVLSDDYMAVAEDRMGDIVAVVTVVDGRIVHDVR